VLFSRARSLHSLKTPRRRGIWGQVPFGEKVPVPNSNSTYIAKKLGSIKPSVSLNGVEDADLPLETPETSEERLRRSVERSRFEDR